MVYDINQVQKQNYGSQLRSLALRCSAIGTNLLRWNDDDQKSESSSSCRQKSQQTYSYLLTFLHLRFTLPFQSNFFSRFFFSLSKAYYLYRYFSCQILTFSAQFQRSIYQQSKSLLMKPIFSLKSNFSIYRFLSLTDSLLRMSSSNSSCCLNDNPIQSAEQPFMISFFMTDSYTFSSTSVPFKLSSSSSFFSSASFTRISSIMSFSLLIISLSPPIYRQSSTYFLRILSRRQVLQWQLLRQAGHHPLSLNILPLNWFLMQQRQQYFSHYLN